MSELMIMCDHRNPHDPRDRCTKIRGHTTKPYQKRHDYYWWLFKVRVYAAVGVLEASTETGASVTDVANQLGMTRERVRLLQRFAMNSPAYLMFVIRSIDFRTIHETGKADHVVHR